MYSGIVNNFLRKYKVLKSFIENIFPASKNLVRAYNQFLLHPTSSKMSH